MNLILNIDKINLNNIKLKYINNEKIKIFYMINDIHLNGISLIFENINYKLENNTFLIKINNDHILQKNNNHFINNIKNYIPYINNDNILKINKIKNIYNNNIYLSFKLLKKYNGFFYLNIYQL